MLLSLYSTTCLHMGSVVFRLISLVLYDVMYWFTMSTDLHILGWGQ